MRIESEAFLSYLISLNYAEETIQNYRYKLGEFEKFVAKDASELTHRDIINFLNKRQKIHSSNTVYIYGVVIKNFLNFLEFQGKRIINAKLIRLPRKVAGKRNFFSQIEIQKILNSIDDSSLVGARHKAMILTLYSSGMRASEVCGLQRNQFDDSREFQIIGKGGKPGLVFINKEAEKAIKKYLSKRSDVSPFLFASSLGVPMNRRKLYKDVKKILSRCGLTGSVHDIRHSFATHSIQKGAHIREVQELLRHTNLNTTMVYTHVTNSRLKKAHHLIFN